MRAWMPGLVVTLSALSGTLQAAPPPAAAQPNPRLESLLRGWETKSRATEDMHCEFQVTTLDAVFKEQRVEYGEASAKRPYFGRLDMKDEKGAWTRIFISTGRAIHQYEFKTQQEIVHVLPEVQPGDKTMPGPLTFVFGMTATEARSRFDLNLEREFSRDGEEYAEVHARPRTQADRQDFKLTKLVFDKKTFLPVQMVVVEPNGNQQRWIFTQIDTNLKPPITAEMLAPFRNLPKGWKTNVNPLAGAPERGGEPPRVTPSRGTRPEAARPQPKR